MIDFSLVNEEVDIDSFNPLDDLPCLFLGFAIRNEYDNRRIVLNPIYNPQNVLHPIMVTPSNPKGKPVLSVLPLKGIVLSPNETIKKLTALIISQEKMGITLQTYQNILSQFNFSCSETYAFFHPGLYPIDYTNLKTVATNPFSTDKKIFQHLLGLDEKTFEFQRFSALKLFILTRITKVKIAK